MDGKLKITGLFISSFMNDGGPGRYINAIPIFLFKNTNIAAIYITSSDITTLECVPRAHICRLAACAQ